MSSYKRRRSALLNVIQGLQDSDFVSNDVVELDEIEETIPETVEESDEFMLPEDEDFDTIISEQDLDEYLSSEQTDEYYAGEQEDEEQEDDEQEDDEQDYQEEDFEDEDQDDYLDEQEDEQEDEQDNTMTASQEKEGIEDIIQDTANGGDPTTSQIVQGGEQAKSQVSTVDQVYPTDSKYVARIVRKFDRIANDLQKMGMKKLAFRLDSLSDKLEKSITNRR